MIAVIDYGIGNLFSLRSSLNYIGCANKIIENPDELRNFRGLVLPGVGAFGDAMDKLRRTGMDRAILERAADGVPLLGICLGMQLLFEESLEYGRHRGLGLLEGGIYPLAEELAAGGFDLKAPHIGWNSLEILRPESPILKNTAEGAHVYYVHSFIAKNCGSSLAAGSRYGVFVPGVVASGNIFGVQFHPEKSGDTGLDMLRAFTEICER